MLGCSRRMWLRFSARAAPKCAILKWLEVYTLRMAIDIIPSSASGTSKSMPRGELVAVDTFIAGTLKGVGKVSIQTVLDCFNRHVWARLYTSKMLVTAIQIGTRPPRRCRRTWTPILRLTTSDDRTARPRQ